MNEEKVRNWLSENYGQIGLENPELLEKKSGESNHNFILKSQGEKYVLRVSREVSRKDRLENEAEKLGFLRQKGADSVPEKIFFSKDSEIGTVLIETFVGKENLNSDKMNKERLRSLARKISRIHNIPVNEYINYSGREHSETVSIREHFQRDFEKWSERPYREYLELCDEPDSRVENFFEKQKKLLKSVPDGVLEKSLVHGDLGFNIRATENNVFIVDWEFCRIDCPDLEILYCFEHEDLTNSQREVFLNEYRKHRDLNNKFDWLRKFYPGFLAFNDAVWSAKRIETESEKKDVHRERLDRKLDKLEKFHSKKR